MNQYLTDPTLAELHTEVAHVVPARVGRYLVAGRENLFRPGGGGQPRDFGAIEINGRQFHVAGLQKGKAGMVYAELPDLIEPPPVGTLMIQWLDINRRERLRRLHSLQHLVSAAAARIVPEAEPCGTDLTDDAMGGWVRLGFAKAPGQANINHIERTVCANVAAAIPILLTRANSVEEARAQYRGIFRLDPSVSLTGKVRLVVIQNTDANPCNALHWHNSAVGTYGLKGVPVEGDGLGELLELRFELS